MKEVIGIEKSLWKMVRKGTHLSEQKHKAYGKYFDIEIFSRTGRIKSYKRNNKAIDSAVDLEGFHILESSVEMTCSDTLAGLYGE